MQAGTDAISFYGGAAVGMRTVLDALVPAAQALAGAATAGKEPPAAAATLTLNEIDRFITTSTAAAAATLVLYEPTCLSATTSSAAAAATPSF